VQRHKRALVTYIRLLLGETLFLASLLLDLLTFLVLGGNLPRYIYLGVVSVGFILANYRVFLQMLDEKERLEEHLRLLEEKIPRLEVRFLVNDKRLPFLSVDIPEMKVPDIDNLVAQRREELLSVEVEPPELTKIMLRQRDPNYQKEVEQYLEKYRQYLRDLFEKEVAKYCVKEIRFVIMNTSIHPAHHITVEIEIPREIRRASREHVLWYVGDEMGDLFPIEPQQPKLYTSILDSSIFPLPPLLGLSNSQLQMQAEEPEWVWSQDKTILRYKREQISPYQEIDDLEPIFLWLCGLGSTQTVEFQVKIYAEELPEPIIHTLYIHVQAKRLREQSN